MQTAAPLAAATGFEPVVVPELREVHLGDWEGGELRIRSANGDPLVAPDLRRGALGRHPGRRVDGRLRRRASARASSAIVARGRARAVSVAAVVHGGVIGEICRQATGARRMAFIHADNASISRLVVLGSGRWLLRSFNDIAHLRGPPRARIA